MPDVRRISATSSLPAHRGSAQSVATSHRSANSPARAVALRDEIDDGDPQPASRIPDRRSGAVGNDGRLRPQPGEVAVEFVFGVFRVERHIRRAGGHREETDGRVGAGGKRSHHAIAATDAERVQRRANVRDARRGAAQSSTVRGPVQGSPRPRRASRQAPRALHGSGRGRRATCAGAMRSKTDASRKSVWSAE